MCRTALAPLDWPRAVALGVMMGLAYLLTNVALSVAPLAVIALLRGSAIMLVVDWSVWRPRSATAPGCGSAAPWASCWALCAVLLEHCDGS